MKIRRLDTVMFSKTKLSNHIIAKHTLILQILEKIKNLQLFFEELKFLNHSSNELNLAGR